MRNKIEIRKPDIGPLTSKLAAKDNNTFQAFERIRHFFGPITDFINDIIHGSGDEKKFLTGIFTWGTPKSDFPAGDGNAAHYLDGTGVYTTPAGTFPAGDSNPAHYLDGTGAYTTPAGTFPAGDGNAAHFLNGVGTYTTPSGGTGTVTHTSGALTASEPVIGNGGADITVGTRSGNTTKFGTVSGTLTSGNLIKSDAAGNLIDGGAIPAGTVTHTGSLTSDAPMFGNGTADSKVGTKSGNTNALATVSGSLTSGHLATWDANSNLVDGGAVPATGGFTTRTDKSAQSLNTAYQNTTGKAILVVVTAINNAGASKSLFAYSNSSNPPTTNYVSFVTGSVSFAVTCSFLVLNNDYYIMKQDSGGNFGVQTWWEYS